MSQLRDESARLASDYEATVPDLGMPSRRSPIGTVRVKIEYGCCKGVQGPSSGVEVSLCVRRSGVLGCRYGNFAVKRISA